MDTCLRMAWAALESGVDTIVCTPHLPEWDPSFVAEAREVVQEARTAFAAAAISLRLLLGFEVDLAVAASVELEELRELSVESSGADGGNGMIIFEMPYGGWPVFMEETIFRVATAGFVPVLAHPERNERVQASSDALRACIRAGAVAQATAGSLSGLFGRTPGKTLGRLLGEGLISLLASDAHATPVENWTMLPMLKSLTGSLSVRDVVTLTQTNPRLLLEGKGALAVRPASAVSRRGLSRRNRFG
jgi:protein-tyrosine phosphatase